MSEEVRKQVSKYVYATERDVEIKISPLKTTTTTNENPKIAI